MRSRIVLLVLVLISASLAQVPSGTTPTQAKVGDEVTLENLHPLQQLSLSVYIEIAVNNRRKDQPISATGRERKS